MTPNNLLESNTLKQTTSNNKPKNTKKRRKG